MRISFRFIAGALVALALLSCFRCYRTYRIFNDTDDEGGHIPAGLEMWQDGKYTLEAQHPPLARLAISLLPHLAGLRYVKGEPLWAASSTPFYWRTLRLAREGNLIFVPFLLLYVYLWGRDLYGPAAGLIAAGVVSFSPNLMAHAAIATLDFGAATTIFISAYYFWRWSRQAGWRPCLAAALGFSIAVLVKFSALFFLPPIAAAFFLIARWSARPWFRLGRWPALGRVALQRGVVFLTVCFLVVWSVYLFDIGPLPSTHIPPVPGTLGQYLESAVVIITRNGSFPAPRFVRGILEVLDHNTRGHPAYLFGRVSEFGWWYYFPVALAVKSTLPLLLLAAMALAVWAWQGAGGAGAILCPLAGALPVLAIGMMSHLNLGIRHILVIYPFLALLAGGLFVRLERSRSFSARALLGCAAVLVVWHAAESLLAAPDYLAYFNQIARGHEASILLDNCLDWGQDLERLRQFAEQRKISTIYLSYFGRTNPRVLGFTAAVRLETGMRPIGWVAISRNDLAGLTRKRSDLLWLQGHTPVAAVGKSILVYHLSAHPSSSPHPS
ncbi:MAG TPA: glycosyltransferase family 39 protein [Bryobacterales bacterium]|nr:glycosyltransferase family 39 protein [Bryobacterales bacterium]